MRPRTEVRDSRVSVGGRRSSSISANLANNSCQALHGVSRRPFTGEVQLGKRLDTILTRFELVEAFPYE